MNEDDAFLSEVIPQLRQEITALHSGDAQPRKALWSHDDQVTLFGADLSGRGWSEIEPVFDRLAASFSGNGSGDYEVLGAGVSGDLGYVAAKMAPGRSCTAMVTRSTTQRGTCSRPGKNRDPGSPSGPQSPTMLREAKTLELAEIELAVLNGLL